ncbi:hypothetical protein AAE478_006293 [Parahypoxylon ruwenzoriense]
MEPRSFKKLAPAPAPTNSAESQAQVSLPVPSTRKNLTRNACSSCKVKKAKCDGNRPTCGRCQKIGDTCLYKVNRRDIVKLQLLSDIDTARLQDFELVFGILQNGTHQQVAEILAQIRLGQSIETIASTSNLSNVLPSASTPSKQPMTMMGPGSTTTGNESSDSSTTGSQSFLDLLFDRNDYPTDNTVPDNTLIDQESVPSFAANPVPEATSSRPVGSDRTYTLPMSTAPIPSPPYSLPSNHLGSLPFPSSSNENCHQSDVQQS